MKMFAFLLAMLTVIGCRSTPTASGLSEAPQSANAFSGLIKASSLDEPSADGPFYMPAVRLKSGRYTHLTHVGIHPGGGFLALDSGTARETRLSTSSGGEFHLTMAGSGGQTALNQDNPAHALILTDVLKVLFDRTQLTDSDSTRFLQQYCSGVSKADLKSMIENRDSWTEACSLQGTCTISKDGTSYELTPVLKKFLD